MTKMKKMKALGVMALMVGGLLAITGCDKDPLMNQSVKQAINDAKLAAKAEGMQEGIASVDITADNADVVQEVALQAQNALKAQKELDEQVIADYKAELEALNVELAEKEAVIVVEQEQAEEAVEREANAYVKDELALEAGVTAFTLDDSELNFLQDTKIKFNGDSNIDIKEEIVFADVGVRTSVYDKEFDDGVYLTVESEDGILYKYSFEDDVNKSLVTKDKPLKINFLGEDLEIVDVSSSSFTVIRGEEVLMKENEVRTMSIDGEDVEVEMVSISDSQSKIAVKVNGALVSGLAEGDVEEVGDYEVYVKTVLANDAGEGDDIAEIRVAKDVETKYDDGDEVVEGDERFVYRIKMDTTIADHIDYLGVAYAEVSNNKDDEYAPITGDEKIVFPNDFIKVGIGLADNEYNQYKFSFATKDDVKSIKIASDDDEGIVIGTDKVDKVYYNGSNVLYKNDNSDDKVALIGAVSLVNDDKSLAIGFSDGANFTIGTKIAFVVDSTMSFLGETKDTAETADITYDDGILEKSYGTQEESLMTSTGLIIVDPENNAKADKFELMVPKDVVKAKIIVE